MRTGILTAALAGGLALGLSSAASAQSVHGTTNSEIGSAGAKGATGKAHSTANRKLRMAPEETTGAVPGSNRSATGMRNSTIGSSGAATGTNGTLHSGPNGPRR